MATNFEDSNGYVLADNDGEILLATGDTLPTDADADYAQGCVFIHTDGTGATALYKNVGSVTSCQFVSIVGGTDTLTPTAADTAGTNVILPGVTSVVLGANVNGVTDFTVLPSLADVPDGYSVLVIAGAANSEVRTPATSAEEINSEDCDGTKEYLITATELNRFTKISDAIGWQGFRTTAIGAVGTPVVPD